MHRRFGRWVSFLAIGAGSALLISCGGNGGNRGGSAIDASVDAPGFGNINADGGVKCKPKTCKDYPSDTCGQQANGCGGLTEKCNANAAGTDGLCPAGEFCGGAGPSRCGRVGHGTDGGLLCIPKTCADYPTGTCGFQSDGCQGLTAKCNANDAGGTNGLCAAGQFCGGGGSGLCGTGIDAGADGGPINNCTLKTCADYPSNTCGQITDGCGGLTPDCNPTCPTGQFCGGGGPGLCGTGTDGGTQMICTALTCSQIGNPCGPQADGCGNTLAACTTCPSGTWCGGGGANQCGNGFTPADGGTSGDSGLTHPCVPRTCSDYPANPCGQQTDGCGGLTANCNPCQSGQFCGGGGPGQCGTGLPADAGTCNPLTCTSFPSGTCGQQSDGCGGLTANCGSCTGTNEYCGGGGPGKCGTGPLADAGACTPFTCSHYPGTCGQHSDGCGGLTANCGSCPLNQYCGGGGVGVCGGGAAVDGGSCNPWTCSHYPGTCGQQSDGCGGLTANCGGCSNPQFCGGDPSKPGQCGGNNGLSADGGSGNQCKPATCASKGYNCGQAGDGCGGTIGPCGTCSAPDACGAGGQANICGSNVACTALCPAQKLCDGASATLSGTVIAGTQSTYGSPDPVPNVLVYIPNSTTGPSYGVQPFTPRALETQKLQCSTCGADVSGNPLVETTTKYDGTFTLNNVPVGTTIPIVIQLGRWRRLFTVNTACGSNVVSAAGMPAGGYLRMPRNSSEGDIPLTAISTGNVDAMECVLLKMGVDSSEFVAAGATSTSATGRIQIFQGNGAVASSGGTTLPETSLMAAGGTYNDYDQVILPCWGVDPTTAGSANAKTATELGNLVTYGTNGGHFFATHYSYAWLYANNPYSLTANWNVNRNTAINSMNGTVSQTVPPTTPVTTPGVFVEWLNYIKALNTNNTPPSVPNPALVTIANARHDVNSIVTPSLDWIDGQDPGHNNEAMLLHYSFDTPVGSSAQCGHAIFSDFHVTNATGTGGNQGTGCQQNSDCNSNICNNLGKVCALNTDCGANGLCTGKGTKTCTTGSCSAYQFPSESSSYCGTTMSSQEKILEYMIWDLAQCVPGQPTSTCVGKTCADLGNPCGQQSDGCGNLITCSSCPAGQTCGGGGVANQCGGFDAGSCTPVTCASMPIGTCGQQANGCGGLTTSCNVCPTGQTCGGGGVAGVCGSSPTSCVPLTCSSYPSGTCGQQTDGCGGLTISCPCSGGQTCGGAGTSGQCGTPPTCTVKTCSDYATGTCGQQSDGCGGLTSDCPCPSGQTCGGAGVQGQCGTPPGPSSCVPLTCTSYPNVCGQQSDGCGSLTADCNPCTLPATCGGGGQAGVCGTPPDASSCIPQTCAAYAGMCGVQSDGCGGTTPYCNPCTAPQTCGGGGTPGVCGSPPSPTCTKLTCSAYAAGTCGKQSDGCGGLTVDCHPCTPPQTCGGGGTAGQCGSPPVGTCIPKTCNDYPGLCGQQSDGCGDLTVDCKPCPTGQTCGGGGTPGVCGSGGACQPSTCTAMSLACGAAGDGCGGTLMCGTCPTNQTCVNGVCTGNTPM
jgi:hypothetical protein